MEDTDVDKVFGVLWCRNSNASWSFIVNIFPFLMTNKAVVHV